MECTRADVAVSLGRVAAFGYGEPRRTTEADAFTSGIVLFIRVRLDSPVKAHNHGVTRM